jgi:hypothetical protein
MTRNVKSLSVSVESAEELTEAEMGRKAGRIK